MNNELTIRHELAFDNILFLKLKEYVLYTYVYESYQEILEEKMKGTLPTSYMSSSYPPSCPRSPLL